MTGGGVTAHLPHQTDMQASMFSDVFAQIESRFNPTRSEAGCYDPSARFTAISMIDKGIDAARQFLRSLFTCRNTLVPISVLPPEILARVFHFLVLEELPFTRKRGKIGWIKVTHVCRHWRQVALDDSSLWAKIWAIPTNPKWISEVLARSKNAPLDVECNAAAMPSREALLMITPHISRTRRLLVRRISRGNSDSVRGILSCEAPALEHFELTDDAASPVISRDLSGSGNMLFKGHYPRLRVFSISQVVIPWSLIPRGQLTHLKISCPFEVADSPGESNELIDLLVNCPSLESLALESSLPHQLTEFSHGRTIHLPRLSRLRFRGSSSRIMNMLKMLKLPSSTTLHLDCIPRTTENDAESLLLSIISAQFQGPSSVKFKSLTVAIRGLAASFLKIIASTYPSTLRNPQSQSLECDILGNHGLVLSFEGLSRPGHWTDLLTQACENLPISNLEAIHIFAENKIDTNWVELFSCCTNATTMEAIGKGTSSFVRALTAPTVTDAGSSKKMGKLEQDSKAGLNLSFPEGKHTLDMLFDVLARGLQQRMVASGAPAPLALRIWHCELITEYADDVRKLVQDFHWDKVSINVYGRWVYLDHPLGIVRLFREPR